MEMDIGIRDASTQAAFMLSALREMRADGFDIPENLEFIGLPNGPPMISRQIKSGMRAGVGELFVKIGETIETYADEFP